MDNTYTCLARNNTGTEVEQLMPLILAQIFLCLVILFCAFPQLLLAASQEYLLARAPQRSIELTEKDWLPFVQYISEKSGVNIKLKLYEKRSQFEKDLQQGSVDFFYGNPGYLVVANKLHDYQPLVRSANSKLKGIVVVRTDSGIKDIKELNGQQIVFPGENAFAASLYLRAQLKKQLGLKFIPKYVSGHDNVYRNVLSGNFVAGGGVQRTLNREAGKVKEQLQIIYETPGMHPHPLVVHPRVPMSIKEKITAVIIDMPNHPNAKELLDKVKLKMPITADYKRDYESIENLALDMYSDLLN